MRQHILLLEMHNLRQMLLEDRIDFLKKNYLARLAEYVKSGHGLTPDALRGARINVSKDTPEIAAEKLFAYIVAFDPDPTKKYTQWMLNLILRNPKKDPMPLEDLEKARDYLTRFEQGKKDKVIPRETDVSRIKSLGELFNLIKDMGQKQVAATDAEKQKAEAESKVVYNSENWVIITPLTRYAAGYWGRGTEWCTAWGEPGTTYPERRNNMFDHYIQQGPLYVLFNKHDQSKYQFHFESQQYMDVNDVQINVNRFLEAYPEIKEFFDPEEDTSNVITEIGGFRVTRGDQGLMFTADAGGRFERRSARGRAPFAIGLSGDTITTVPNQLLHLTDDKAENRWNQQPSGLNPIDSRSPNRHAVIDLFNKLGLNTDEHTSNDALAVMAACNIWYDPEHKRFGDSRSVGQRIVRGQDGAEWRKLPCGHLPSNQFYDFVKGNNVYGRACYAAAQDKLSVVGSGIPSPDIADLVLATKPEALDFDLDTLKPEDVKRVLDKLPKLGTVASLLAAYGPDDERFRNRLHEVTEEWEIDRQPEILPGDKVLLHRFKNIEELVQENGGRNAEWFLNHMNGEENFDIPDSDYHDLDYYLTNLKRTKPETVKKVGEYMAQAYPDEIEDLFEEGFDPSDEDEIVQLQNDVDDDGLQTCVRWANSRGAEIGAQNELSEIFMRELNTNHYIYAKSGNEWKRGNIPWDTELAVIAPLDEFVEIFKDEDVVQEYLDRGWLHYKGEFINPEEPRNGFDGFDDEAAEEYFEELLGEHGIVSHDPA